MTTAHGTPTMGTPTMEPLPRKRLHQLIDELPEDEIGAAELYLQSPCADDDPVIRSVRTAPVDDEPLADEDRAAIDEGRSDIAAGHGIPHHRVLRKLGL